jgi:hypothetical protein
VTVESASVLESALRTAQGDAEAALRSASGLTRELRKAKAAAATGARYASSAVRWPR